MTVENRSKRSKHYGTRLYECGRCGKQDRRPKRAEIKASGVKCRHCGGQMDRVISAEDRGRKA